MQRVNYLRNKTLMGVWAILVCISIVAVGAILLNREAIVSETCDLNATPWSSVGGCGGGGSGGGSADGIKWIGSGVSGGLIDIEVLPKFNFGQNFQNFTIAPRFSFKPTWTTQVGISVPVVSKTGEVQYRSNQPAKNRTTGGLGDLSIDLSKSLGMSGQYSLGLSVSIPTGQYDIKRGPDGGKEILPASLQKGGGLWNASLSLGYTKDVEDGMWLVDGSFSYPFNFSLTGENQFMDEYFSDYKDSTSNSRFFYTFKPYGENDLGAYSPPSVSGAIYYAYRGIDHYVHSWGVSFGAPLGVAWVANEKEGKYDPRPDPDHQAWSAAFVYGIEFSRRKFPMYMAVSLPIHDKANDPAANEYDPAPMRQWDAPDWSDFGQQWTFALGFKATVF